MAAHPGISKTNLASHVTGLKGLGLNILAYFAQDADHGALPTLYAATGELPGASYAGPDGPGERRGYPAVVHASETARDSELAPRLWEVSSRLTGTLSEPASRLLTQDHGVMAHYCLYEAKQCGRCMASLGAGRGCARRSGIRFALSSG